MAAGSFIDLLCQQTDRSTGRPFTDFSIAAQALSLLGAGAGCVLADAQTPGTRDKCGARAPSAGRCMRARVAVCLRDVGARVCECRCVRACVRACVRGQACLACEELCSRPDLWQGSHAPAPAPAHCILSGREQAVRTSWVHPSSAPAQTLHPQARSRLMVAPPAALCTVPVALFRIWCLCGSHGSLWGDFPCSSHWLPSAAGIKTMTGRLAAEGTAVSAACAAGTETTASTITFACWNLARCPDKAAKLQAEIDAHLGEGHPFVLGPDPSGAAATESQAMITPRQIHQGG